MERRQPPSPISHLLWGISWEGRNVNKKYRGGGRGVEEVLTTEVLLGLEFLPRRPFCERLVEYLSTCNGSGPFLEDREIDTLQFLPTPAGRHALKPDAPTHQKALDVQVDAMVESDFSRIFIEAKRAGSSSFQEEQLARTFVIALRESGARKPRVLFILGHPPPVKIQNVGTLDVRDGILARLDTVYQKTDYTNFTLSEAKECIDECVAWITWQELAEAVETAMSEYENPDGHTYAAVARIARFIGDSVDWHSRSLE